MRILVTGGAGFIGSHTCLTLLEKGYEIVVIDSFINSQKESLKNIRKIIKNDNYIFLEVIKGDIRDEKVLNKIFVDSKKIQKPIEAVIHFAGLKSVEASVNNSLKYWDANVAGTLNLLKVMKIHNCKTIVFSSSATIYGKNNKNPLKEDAFINPGHPYGRTKAVIEKILEDLNSDSSMGWRIANLRYFNPIGAHPSGLIGESPIGVPSNIFPYITQVAAGILDELSIFGNNWPTIDGTGVRDYIHVLDIAEGHLSALEYLLERKDTLITMNLGTGIGTSVLELINTFEDTNKVKIPYKFTNRREGDLGYVVADNSLAISRLKWIPKRDLRKMCLDGWKWQLSNSNGYS